MFTQLIQDDQCRSKSLSGENSEPVWKIHYVTYPDLSVNILSFIPQRCTPGKVKYTNTIKMARIDTDHYTCIPTVEAPGSPEYWIPI